MTRLFVGGMVLGLGLLLLLAGVAAGPASGSTPHADLTAMWGGAPVPVRPTPNGQCLTACDCSFPCQYNGVLRMCVQCVAPKDGTTKYTCCSSTLGKASQYCGYTNTLIVCGKQTLTAPVQGAPDYCIDPNTGDLICRVGPLDEDSACPIDSSKPQFVPDAASNNCLNP